MRGIAILSEPENIKEIRKHVRYTRSQSSVQETYYRVKTTLKAARG